MKGERREELERARTAVEQTGDGEYALEWISRHSSDPQARDLVERLDAAREEGRG